MRKGLFWLTDKQWARIEPHLPTNQTGPERDADRCIISGIVHASMRRALARLPTGLWPVHDYLSPVGV